MYCVQCGVKLLEGAKYCIRCGASVPSVPAAPRVFSVPEAAKPKRGWGRLVLAFMALAIAVVGEVVGYVVGLAIPGMDEYTPAVVGGAVGGVLGVLLTGATPVLTCSRASFVTALRKGWWILFVSLALTLYDIVATMLDGGITVADGLTLRLIDTLVLCAAIGVFEETTFRVLLLGGLLAVGGRRKRGVVVCVLLAAVLFGMAHVDWVGMDYADPLSVAQGILKVVQTGVFGFFLGSLVLRTGDMVGAAFLHGFSDFLLMITSIVIMGDSLSTDYVSTGAEAVATVALYVVVILLYVPLAAIGARMLSEVSAPRRTCQKEEGPTR